MFTGIITDVGELIGREGGRFAIRSRYAADGIALGASIACDGCCLSVVTLRADGAGSAFTVDVSNETLSKTTLGSWQVGRRINLERALKAGDELGGHIVSGHVDGVGQIIDMRADGESIRVLIELPQALAPYAAPKGSIALDGTSLTVNEVSGNRFGVNLIPVTLTETTWGRKKPGDEVNVEIDLFARYVARIMEFRV
ncbi:MAG TPA: riboflavin synthase [Hyphomicrobium zavarzinii]|uniref:riboflavin synthase n=1 Tax=Hyphomicrobium sp. DMF-1 TaxID=3019544 RepID=UPI0022EBFBFD|nr:riboflavin synthase [Hyphomicrobium sp. DMF-1]WBT40069.1 riboflavin synthase [Hyphomicrobium sp. DMF-1]HML44538.1 riboflavin synthase [Hyphomicrobium zavarzinii]